MRALIVAAALQMAAGVACAQQAVILVRHAELQGSAMAAPKQVALSGEGEARAQRLAAMLHDSGVAAIYVTDFLRTNQTAQPLAHALDQPLTIVPKGDPQHLVERLRKSHAGQTVLLVGHTDTLPGLIKALGYGTEIKIDPKDYGSVFVVTPRAEGAPGFVRLHY